MFRWLRPAPPLSTMQTARYASIRRAASSRPTCSIPGEWRPTATPDSGLIWRLRSCDDRRVGLATASRPFTDECSEPAAVTRGRQRPGAGKRKYLADVLINAPRHKSSPVHDRVRDRSSAARLDARNRVWTFENAAVAAWRDGEWGRRYRAFHGSASTTPRERTQPPMQKRRATTTTIEAPRALPTNRQFRFAVRDISAEQ